MGEHVKYARFFSDFNESLICSTNFRKILKYEISWNSVQRESSCSMRTEGQTEVAELIVTFRNFSKAPKHDPYPFFRVLGILWRETTMSKSMLKQSFRLPTGVMCFGRLPPVLTGLELCVPLSACQGRRLVVMSGNGNSHFEPSWLLSALCAYVQHVINRMYVWKYKHNRQQDIAAVYHSVANDRINLINYERNEVSCW